ncbi:helix-turn-helix domain-containing protein [Agriterribacter sp.]|uniref:helix-turn-helix domain-containing protein n=1 Tax=Agriterribacter sp. TaxID=2821509 RepID=UPI002C3B582E|nr:helix-turn-helix domain-containing protein [Agriterribacter sp.]HRO47653.1 helix-turn-helix domain-containing protein [Agriterribacter sp.]HRQ17624.1 helix-turn-helix domain-containing protein [Agriterribacter sp.]
MLDIELFDSDKNNEWLVRQFEAYRFSGSSLADKFIPRADISIIFHFKDCPFISGEASLQLEPFFVAPIIPRAIMLQFGGNMDTLAITCKATVFSRLFELDMSPVPKRSINLPQHIFFPVWKAMAHLNTTNERIAYFSGFINSVQQTPYCPDAVDMLYGKILEKSITHPLKEIMQECFASKSTLLRKFIKRTGVSPKTLARVVRLNYLWTKIRDENAMDYQELIFDGNYFDQSHFINDFKAIVGETPGYFFNRNLNIVKMFSGKPAGEI